MVNSNIFQNIIVLVIITNTILMCLEGNYFDPDTWEKIDSVNLLFNAIYIAEFGFKLVGLGVLIYFGDFSNVLDFIIVCLCVIDFVQFADEDLKKIRELNYLRLFRVLRVFKILYKIKLFKKIMSGMMSDIVKVMFLVLLFVIFLIIFILFGMSFLGAKKY